MIAQLTLELNAESMQFAQIAEQQRSVSTITMKQSERSTIGNESLNN
jgi:hypothetical protein